MVFISHRLSEVFSIADRITVLRHGSVVATLDARKTDGEAIARLMVGATNEEKPQTIPLSVEEPGRHTSSIPVAKDCGRDFLETRNLSVRSSGAEPLLESLSLSINRGEIFGFRRGSRKRPTFPCAFAGR